MEQTKEKEEEDNAHRAWLLLGNSLPLSLCAMCLGFSPLFHSLPPCNAAPCHMKTHILFSSFILFPFYLLSISLSAMCLRFFPFLSLTPCNFSLKNHMRVSSFLFIY
eukprot:TRINITY_DN70823_c0_g1_i1.p1 TRINITY_DN70823_c0_g1~~TRINITY_DN70823_c0_g1_i1.p1  ORF type:complete len:107 (+),score=9.73 TRINITY_DN70823_c0_g1_i1:153-473(+)